MSELKAGGTLHENHLYIQRSADRELREALEDGQFAFVLAPRQIGKSSLRARCESHLRKRGLRSATVDLTRIGTQLTDVSQWYTAFLEEVAEQLKLPTTALHQAASSSFSPAQNWAHLLTSVILNSAEQPLIVFVDEIECLLALPAVSDDFFAAVRALYNRRADQPELRRLSFCLLGVAAPHDLVQNPSRTPFNVGRQVRLEDFTRAEVLSFVPALERLGLSSEPWIEQVYYWTNGHPYMTQRLFWDIQEQLTEHTLPIQARGVAEFVRGRVEALFFASDGHEARNLRYSEQRFEQSRYRPSLITTYRRVLSESRELRVACDASDLVQIELLVCGLCAYATPAAGRRYLTVRNRIIQELFGLAWLREQERRSTQSETVARALASPDQSDNADLDTLRKWLRTDPRQVLVALASHIQSQRKAHILSVQISGQTSSLSSSPPEDPQTTILPLAQYLLIVRWKNAAPAAEPRAWLQRVAAAFARKVLGRTAEAASEQEWTFIAGSTGRSQVRELARRVAELRTCLLIRGPVGIGKDVLARDIHAHGSRSKKPFIAANLSIIPEALFDVELFGVVRGSFTDAKDRPGLLEQAHGGTLYLEEIGDLPLHLQAKLLRVDEGRLVRRVGDQRDRIVDVRIIVSTNRDIRALVDRGAMREDFFYRFSGMCLTIPPLEPADVLALTPVLLRQLDASSLAEHEEEVAQLAASKSWTGAVRELRATLQRLVDLFEPQRSIIENWQQAYKLGAAALTAQDVPPPEPPVRSLASDLAELERSRIAQALSMTSGNLTQAADLLGLSRHTLQKKTRQLGLK